MTKQRFFNSLLEPARLTTTPKLLLVALVERLETPATARKNG